LDKFSVTNLAVGTRGTLKEFKTSYQPEFLSKYGYKRYTKTVPFSVCTVCETVNVKYSSIQGELVVHDNDVLTYLGHKFGAVTKNREHEDESNR
jgi:hypothetical protein